MSTKKLVGLVRAILIELGENPSREGLRDTPDRVARMYQEMFLGYDPEKKPNLTSFSNSNSSSEQLVSDHGYFYSHCEHHMVPFFGEYYFGYIPNGKIIGLSKIARLVDYHSARLQVQENLTKEILDTIEKELKPKGTILIMKARHLCKEMRGVKKNNGEMTTMDARGIFKESHEKRKEFMDIALVK
ncbi:MAG: GTP cyclohydrolase I FolE [Candidatus Moraniibacteriota bacterium]